MFEKWWLAPNQVALEHKLNSTRRDSMARVAINGFGRIGRNALRALLESPIKDLEVVAINDPIQDLEQSAHLLKYDSILGELSNSVSHTKDALVVDGKSFAFSAERDPANCPWAKHKVDIVLECSGVFTDAEKAQGHRLQGRQGPLAPGPRLQGDLAHQLPSWPGHRPAGRRSHGHVALLENAGRPAAAQLATAVGGKPAAAPAGKQHSVRQYAHRSCPAWLVAFQPVSTRWQALDGRVADPFVDAPNVVGQPGHQCRRALDILVLGYLYP